MISFASIIPNQCTDMTATAPSVRTFDIAVLPGDGIGVDVTREAVHVLQALETGHGAMKFAFHESS